MPRLFIAVDLSISVVERLALLQREWAAALRDADVRISWVAPENIHLTLKFLGELGEPLVPMIEQTLATLVRPLFPFEVGCQRVGAFPDPRRPRILWAGLEDKGAEVIGLLRQAIEQDIDRLGIAPDDRPFHPHVTLGRVKSLEACDMRDLVASLGAYDFGSSFIKDIVLYESILTSSGPEYRVRNRFSLGET